MRLRIINTATVSPTLREDPKVEKKTGAVCACTRMRACVSALAYTISDFMFAQPLLLLIGDFERTIGVDSACQSSVPS